jgi:hypothetical protein
MLDQDFLNRIENVNEVIQWTDLDFEKNKGTVTCPFCQAKSKGYLYDYYFKCFSSKCGIKGNKISIYQQLKQITFYEALTALESLGSIDLQIQEEFILTRHNLLSEVLFAYSNELLNSIEGLKALAYLESRGFNKEFLIQERVGYSGAGAPLKSYDININALRRQDLIRGHQEFLNNRLIFPVYNSKGYIVHLTGRSYPVDNPQYKYLDTSAMPNIGSCKDYMLFERHIPLYLTNKNTLFIVEGVPDSYILKQAGLNVLGLMGLQKLIKQGSKLQYFKHIIAVFDNDRFELDHPNFPGELKSWRVVLPQLVDLQIYLGHTVHIDTIMIPEEFNLNNKQVKDVNDLFLYLNKDTNLLIEKLYSFKQDIIETFISFTKGNYSYHKTALKLIAASGRGKELLQDYVPNDLSALEYALKVLST